MRLTLLVPELVWPEPADENALARLACPGLEWLLARGRSARGPRQSYEAALARCFGLDAGAPFGALRLLGEPADGRRPDPRDGFWLCADPVHLRFHHERIVLADAGAFDLSDAEADALADALNREFADVGQFHVAAARRWYVRIHTAAELTALPLSAVAGRRMDGELPAESSPSPLRRWLNEVQMFLHGHPVNVERQAAGKPAVNSLWLWGAGPLRALPAPDFTGVWADAPLPVGLARAAAIPVRPLPASLADFLASPPTPGDHLLVLDALLAPVLYEDAPAWRAALEDLDRQWFTPLAKALGRRIDHLTLVAPTIYGQLSWEIGAADRWRFWRRPQPLAATAKALVP